MDNQNQPNISEQQPQPEIPQKTQLSMWVSVLIVVLSVIIVGGVSFSAFRYFGQEPVEPNELPASQELDSVFDWQTYKNEEYGFELKYPTNWRKIENDGFIGFGPQTVASDLIFTIYKDKSIPEVGVGSNRNQEITKVKGIQFKGLPAKNISIKNISLNKVSNRIFINYNDFILSIGQSTVNNTDYPFDHKYNNIIDEILSTFKFIEVDKTLNWQTYKNEEYGFEITLTNAWKGYKVVEKDGFFSFLIPIPSFITTNNNNEWLSIFNLIGISKSEWERRQNEGPPTLPLVAENDSYVFSYGIALHDLLPKEMDLLEKEIDLLGVDQIISTFKFKN